MQKMNEDESVKVALNCGIENFSTKLEKLSISSVSVCTERI